MAKLTDLTVEDLFDYSESHYWAAYLNIAFIALAVTFLVYIIV